MQPIDLTTTESKGALLSLIPMSLHSLEPITAENVLESMTDGYFTIDLDLNVTYINELAEMTFRRKRKDIGVERLEEVDFLISSGCTVFQGYLFDKPLKTDDFKTKYLENNKKFKIEGQNYVYI